MNVLLFVCFCFVVAVTALASSRLYCLPDMPQEGHQLPIKVSGCSSPWQSSAFLHFPTDREILVSAGFRVGRKHSRHLRDRRRRFSCTKKVVPFCQRTPQARKDLHCLTGHPNSQGSLALVSPGETVTRYSLYREIPRPVSMSGPRHRSGCPSEVPSCDLRSQGSPLSADG
jgi:hypothetical protein